MPKNLLNILLLGSLALGLGGCSIKKMAINMVGDTLAEAGETFAADNDPDLVGEATPFSLKLMESLLDSSPKHLGLLAAACKGFTQYSYAYVHMEADFNDEKNYPKALFLRGRAKRLYIRARDYGLRGLEVDHGGFTQALRTDSGKALAGFKKKEAGMLYWTGLSWMAAVSLGKDDPALLGDMPLAEALIARAYALDPDHDAGTLEEFYVTYEGARPEAMGGSVEKAREHFKKALRLSQGLKASTYLALAESVAVKNQDRKEFKDLLGKALAVDVDKKKEWRLLNLIYQKRAKWLLTQEHLLFLD